MENLYNLIKNLGQKYNCNKITLFGSRARGDCHERSDIDLAVSGMDKSSQTAFSFDIEELPTLLKFDIVYIDIYTNPELLKNIEKDGVVIYEKN